jgi:molybdate transport system ATP-binding protein
MNLDARIKLQRGVLALSCSLAASSDHTVALLGPNGAGKTTVLRVLAGLLRIDAGRIALDDLVFEDTQPPRWMEPEARRVGMVFQEQTLFPHLSVVDNIAFGLRARGVDRATARQRAYGWLDRIGLRADAARRPYALSGGQAQRVALARALITEPRMLLLDEPLASVDTSAKLDLRRTLREHLATFTGVRILVTHDPLEAAALADRVLILEAGQLVQEGTFAEVTARPRSLWAARMAGLNLLRGVAENDRLHLDGGAVLMVATDVVGNALAAIRPSAVSLHREMPSGSPRNVVRGTVAGIDPEGDRWRIRVDGTVPLVAEVTPAAATELSLADGGRVFAAIKATEIDVYPE